MATLQKCTPKFMATLQKCTPKENNDWESTTIKTLVTLCKRPPQSPLSFPNWFHKKSTYTNHQKFEKPVLQEKNL
jgi:hypothetical protein